MCSLKFFFKIPCFHLQENCQSGCNVLFILQRNGLSPLGPFLTNTCTHVHLFVCARAHPRLHNTNAHSQHTNTHIHKPKHPCTQEQKHAHAHTHLHALAHVRTHDTNTCTHKHTHTDEGRHTQDQAKGQAWYKIKDGRVYCLVASSLFTASFQCRETAKWKLSYTQIKS